MGKKILTVAMVLALLILLPVFSYAVTSDFQNYTDITSSFSKFSRLTSSGKSFLIIFDGYYGDDNNYLSVSLSSSYDYQFIFSGSVSSSSVPYMTTNDINPVSGSSVWNGEFSSSDSDFTLTFKREDAKFSGSKDVVIVFPVSSVSSFSNLKVYQGTLKTEPEPHDILVTASGNGTASADVSSAIEGTTVNLTATPAAGYQFDRWEVVSGGITVSNNQFVMPDEDVVITAVFSPIQYTISVSSDGNGSASSNLSTATAGTTVTLTATPDDTYVFSEWQVLEGDIEIINNQFIMPDSDVSVKAVFVPDGAYSVTVENDGFGTGSANPVRTEEGTRVTLSAVPVLGYEFDSWEVVSGGVNISNNQFIMPASDVVVKAKFKPIVYTITLNQGSNGSATVSQNTGIIGDTITLTAEPNDLYSFVYWDVSQGGVVVENNQFTMPASNVVITPVFVKQTAVSSGYKFNSGVLEDRATTARLGLADINFGEQPAGEYLINIYSYGQNYGVSFDLGVGSDTTTTRKLPYTQSGGVTTALYTHDGGEMVLDLNFTYYKSVLNSIFYGSNYGSFYEGTGQVSGNLIIASSGNWIFNIIDVTATPVGLANSEDYGIYAALISFLRDKFDTLISVFGSEKSEEDVDDATESLKNETAELESLSSDLNNYTSNIEEQMSTDFAVSDDLTSQTGNFQLIYSGLFSSLGVFSIFIWLPVLLSVIKKLLRL